MNILYITDNLTSSSVFRSQVHNLCNAHSNHNNVKVMAFCKLNDLTVRIEDSQYELIRFIRPPVFSVPIIAKLVSLFFNSKCLFEWADIIHCRGHGPSLVSFYLQDKFGVYKPTIVDIRGAVVEEVKNANQSYMNHLLSQEILRTEEIIFKRASYFFFVSENMKNYFNDIYDLNSNYLSVFPTIVNENFFYTMPDVRDSLRGELKLNSKFVYVYSGGQAYWQNINEILSSFDEKAKDDKNIHLLMLVLDKAFVLNLLEQLNINIKNVTVLSLKYEDVGKYLNACDAGLIIRDDSIVNYVASPTKINEYIACGLKIVDDLAEIGNYSYTSRLWGENYMSLDDAVREQSHIYKSLV